MVNNMKNFKLTYQNEYRKVYISEIENKKGEKIIIELCRSFYDNKNKNSLPNLWLKHSYTNHLYNSGLWVNCEVIDKKGNHIRKYEPTTKLSEDKKRLVIDFNWLFEATEENEKKLLKETIKRFKEAK